MSLRNDIDVALPEPLAHNHINAMKFILRHYGVLVLLWRNVQLTNY
jgi:hypothetical protein